jgi:hypothetical protein
MKRFVILAALLPMTIFGTVSVNGEWKATVPATNTQTHTKHPIGIYAKLSESNGQLTGTAGTQNRMVPIQNASISGSTITFSINEEKVDKPRPVRLTTFTLTQSGADLVGTIVLFDHERLNVTMTPVSSKP